MSDNVQKLYELIDRAQSNNAQPNPGPDPVFRFLCFRELHKYQEAAKRLQMEGNHALAAIVARDARRLLRVVNAAEPWAVARRLWGDLE